MLEVKLVKVPDDKDWLLCKRMALLSVHKTTDKPPDMGWKKKILQANHSPIRSLQFCFLITGLPYYVSTHLVRHVHALPVVSSQRNDRQDSYDRCSARQDAPVDMYWYMSAEELITIAHKRLCNKASPETREVVQKMCDLVVEACPEFEGLLVPNCVYRGGLCDEINCCGRNKKI